MGGSYAADRCLDFSQRIRAMSLDADAKKVPVSYTHLTLPTTPYV